MRKFSWILQRGILWSTSLINLSSTDRFLVSFPKAGSTWVRYFLCEILCQRCNVENSSMDMTNHLMPEFAHKSLFSPWEFDECARIIKTHQKYNLFFRNKTTALIVRDPRDITVSFYHYATGSKEYNYNGTVSEMLRHPSMGLEAFLAHYKSWSERAKLILKYEDVKNAPFEHFSMLLDFYGIQRSEDEIHTAIARSDFSAMKKAQANSNSLKAEFKEGHQFVRSGKSAQWKELFSSQDVEYYEKLRKQYDFDLYD